jgi:hypothetical protein
MKRIESAQLVDPLGTSCRPPVENHCSKTDGMEVYVHIHQMISFLLLSLSSPFLISWNEHGTYIYVSGTTVWSIMHILRLFCS